MPEIVIRNSTISGLHITKNSSHPDVTLLVFPDTTWKDENAMQVAVPSQENLAPETLRLVTWPRNPVSRRYVDQLVQDVAGKKVGNVPANLCKLFKDLLKEGIVTQISARSTAQKPRRSVSPPTTQSFQKRAFGLDRPGGGVVLDCLYTLHVTSVGRSAAVRRLTDLFEKIGGKERLDF